MTLKEWHKVILRGTSGDQVHDILRDWDKYASEVEILLDDTRRRIEELGGEYEHKYCGCTYCRIGQFLTSIREGK